MTEIEQFKRIQTRYTHLTDLSEAIDKCLERDSVLNFIPPKEFAHIFKTQAKVINLSEKLERQAQKLYPKLKKWK